MKNSKILCAFALGLFAILSIGLASADVLIAGTVYNGNVSNPISGVLVTATCDGASSTYTSEGDGAYAIQFTGVDYCLSHNAVSASEEVTEIYLPDGTAPSSSSSSGGGSSSSSGSGSRGTGYCATEWTCSEWSTCSNNIQTRTCSYPSNFCTPRNAKPSETQTCISGTGREVIEETNNQPTTNFLTGFVTGIGNFAKSGLGIGTGIFLVLLIGGSVVFFSVRKKGKIK
jgi:hypothetical protein